MRWLSLLLLFVASTAHATTLAERIGIAYWVTVAEHPRLHGHAWELGKSPGLSLEIATPPAGSHLELLFGVRSGGVGLFTRDFQGKRARWSFGAGAITKYSAGVVHPFVGLTVKFWAQCHC